MTNAWQAVGSCGTMQSAGVIKVKFSVPCIQFFVFFCFSVMVSLGANKTNSNWFLYFQRLNEVALSDAYPMSDLYYAVLGLKALRQRPTDVAKVLRNVQSALKKDDSALRWVYFLFDVLRATGKDIICKWSIFFYRSTEDVS